MHDPHTGKRSRSLGSEVTSGNRHVYRRRRQSVNNTMYVKMAACVTTYILQATSDPPVYRAPMSRQWRNQYVKVTHARTGCCHDSNCQHSTGGRPARLTASDRHSASCDQSRIVFTHARTQARLSSIGMSTSVGLSVCPLEKTTPPNITKFLDL